VWQELSQAGIDFWQEDARQIKRAAGLMRGKDDRSDAQRIARYAQRYQDRKRLAAPPEPALLELGALLSELELLKKQRQALRKSAQPLERFMPQLAKQRHARQAALLKEQDRAIAAVTSQIRKLIKAAPRLAKQCNLLCSIPGIGPVTAWHFIYYTCAFTRFTDARQLACYCGVAPFPHESGSYKGRRRVSPAAQKKLKQLLHMAALASIKTATPLQTYYAYKTQAGKNKMLVINNVRNKLIALMMAIIRQEQPYQPAFAAQAVKA
jgi:transposase